MINISGIFLALIRLLEPFVLSQFIYQLKRFMMCHPCKKLINCFTCKNRKITKYQKAINDKRRKLKKEKDEHKNKIEFSEESLDAFMNSTVNIEYVYLILLGIQKFLVSQSIEILGDPNEEDDT